MKITKQQIRRIIKEAMTDHQDAGMQFDSNAPMQIYVDNHIDDFVDAYIRKSSLGAAGFMDWWEFHCDEEGIPCTQDHLVALVDRAERMGEVEEGELFVGLRGN